MAKPTDNSFDLIMSDLRAKRYKPVYLLMGEEAYYIDQISDFIQNNVLREDEREFNQTLLYGKEVDMTAIINAAKRYPMMSEYQVIIVKEAQNLKEWDNLSYYLQNPLNSTILVFCYKYGTLDKRKVWVKEIGKIGVLFESEKLRDYQIAAWVKNYAQAKKIAIDEKAVAMLGEFLGTDLSKIVGEIDKLLITLPKENQRITPEIIDRNIGISKDFNVFELQEALIKKDALKANRIINYFAANKKNNPLVLVLPQLFNFFANVMLYHYLQPEIKLTGRENFNEKREKSAKIGTALGIPPYPAADNVANAAMKFNAWKTMAILSFIRETDARSKGIESNGVEDGDLLKELVFRILH